MSFEAEKTTFLNDIAVRNNNILYVSASDIDKLFAVNVAKKTYTAIESNLPQGINGLWYAAKEDALYVNGMGKKGQPVGELGCIKNIGNPKKQKYEVTLAKKGYMDGLCVPETDMILYSDWVGFEGQQGRIFFYDPKTEVSRGVPLHRAFGGPADFYFDTETSCFYIPLLSENKIWIEQIGDIMRDVEVEGKE